jgi:hypothetical protein
VSLGALIADLKERAAIRHGCLAAGVVRGDTEGDCRSASNFWTPIPRLAESKFGSGADLVSSDIRKCPRHEELTSIPFASRFREGWASERSFAKDRSDVFREACSWQPVEDCGGHHGIAKDLAPFADSEVRGYAHGAALAARADKVEEQMGRIRLEGQIAEPIDDQELGLGVMGESLLEPSVLMRLGELSDKGRRRREEHGVSGDNGFAADRHG